MAQCGSMRLAKIAYMNDTSYEGWLDLEIFALSEYWGPEMANKEPASDSTRGNPGQNRLKLFNKGSALGVINVAQPKDDQCQPWGDIQPEDGNDQRTKNGVLK